MRLQNRLWQWVPDTTACLFVSTIQRFHSVSVSGVRRFRTGQTAGLNRPGIPTVTAILLDTPYAVAFSDDLGHQWQGDEPESAGGGNLAPPPERLILSGLGACTVITVKMVATRRQIPLTGVEVELQLNPAGKPATGNDVVRNIRLRGELSEDQRAQLLKAANACPMHKLLTGEIRVATALVE